MSRGNNHTGDSKRYYDWLYHACQDMMSARLLMGDSRLYGQVVFHSQQAIEKALKAFLLWKHRKLYDGHNLTWLCKQAALTDGEFTQWISKCALLNRFYIETRYPADIPEDISREFAEDILNAAAELTDYVFELVKFDYKSYHKRR